MKLIKENVRKSGDAGEAKGKISQKLRECVIVCEPICNRSCARTADTVLVKAAEEVDKVIVTGCCGETRATGAGGFK
jgi:hypothetical protein